MDEEGDRPGAGTRHATQPPAGAAAGGRTSMVATHEIILHSTTVVGSNRGLGEGQDNGESIDVAQELGTTPDTASAAFNRLRYAMAVETNTTSQPVSDNNKSESKTSTVSRQDTGELRNMGKRFDTLLGTASATTNRLNYVTDAPERGTSPKLGMTCGTSAEETILDKDKDGTASRAECNAGFDSFDTDENDYITAKEFSAVAHQGFVFDALDCDGDGKITREEYNAGFDTMDLNKDGTLSREELNCAIFSMLDKDGDGLLSREEYEAGFSMMDSDKDGVIFKLEFICAVPSSACQDRYLF